MQLKIGIIGSGSWATALAKILTDNALPINWWIRNELSANYMQKRKHNPEYLSTVNFNLDLLNIQSDIRQTINISDILLIAIPSSFLHDIFKDLPKDILKDKKVISAVKGILPHKNLLLNNYLAQEFNFNQYSYYSISGPCHAEEVAQEKLSYLTFSGEDLEETKMIASLFQTNYIRTTVNQDIYGTQYAGVLKNIYALGAGIAHGLDYGDNFLSVYITNCYRESIFLLKAQMHKENLCQEKIPDLHTSAYLGDLLVTSYSPHSRNRRFGNFIGKGYSIEATIAEMNMIAEGYNASKGMQNIIKDLQISLPILECIYSILWEDKSPKEQMEKIAKILN